MSGDERKRGEVGRRGGGGMQRVFFGERRVKAGREGVDVRVREGCQAVMPEDRLRASAN